jgi:dTMP kinase
MFITIEGPEGSGKTSVMNLVCSRLLADGYPIVRTREPGGTPIAEKIRDIILDKANTNLDPRAEALLYAASRRQHLIEKVWPASRKGISSFATASLIHR